MDKISELDDSIERLERLAKLLEEHVGPCSSTMRLVAWLATWIKSSDDLAAIERSLPTLPQELRSAYAAWLKMGE